MVCPKCGSAVWFGDKCAGCGSSVDGKPEPKKESAKPEPDSSDES